VKHWWAGWLLLAALQAPLGAAAEPLALPGLDGVTRSLASWRGRAVLLSFWATWCEPCIAEVPHLVKLQAHYGERGLTVVSVGVDVVRTLDINYPVLVEDPDRARPLLAAWGDKSGVIPYLVLLDRQGRVTATHRGPIDADELEEMVKPLLAAQTDGER